MNDVYGRLKVIRLGIFFNIKSNKERRERESERISWKSFYLVSECKNSSRDWKWNEYAAGEEKKGKKIFQQKKYAHASRMYVRTFEKHTYVLAYLVHPTT